MGSALTNVATIQQSFTNNINQDSQQFCAATTTSTQNNNTIIINGTKIDGNLTGVSNIVSTDASCNIVSTIEDSVSNILAATLQQTNTSETDAFNGFQITGDTNDFNMTQSVTNNINQINQATCSANTVVSQNNNYIYVTNSTVGGDFVGVSSDSTSNASCVMSNYMKNATYNQAQASGNQSNTDKGMWAQFLSSIAGIAVFMVIGSVIFLFYNTTKKQQEQNQQMANKAIDTVAQNPELLNTLAANPELLAL